VVTSSPASHPAPQRWYQERPSDYPWEQDGLDHIKRLMPAAEPFRAFATFSFTAASGRIHECDLLIATPGGLHLLELKAHSGRVINHDDTWRFTEPETGRVRTLRNPLHFTDAKSKDLKSGLEWTARKLKMPKLRIPRVEPAVFLSDPGLRAHLDEVQMTRVYGRDEAAEGLPWIWRDLLARPPRSEHQRVRPTSLASCPAS
jgi:Nuclease-related domain